jgi:hypothetical protein
VLHRYPKHFAPDARSCKLGHKTPQRALAEAGARYVKAGRTGQRYALIAMYESKQGGQAGEEKLKPRR